MSTSRSGNTKKQGQKYQNAFAYQHNKNSKLTKRIMALPVDGLCFRCKDIVDWRKRFRKYKPLTQPKVCTSCSKRTVTKAYHVICDGCAEIKKVCAKCLERTDIAPKENYTPTELFHEEQKRDNELRALRERDRRKVLRLAEAEAEDDSDAEGSDDDEDGAPAGKSEPAVHRSERVIGSMSRRPLAESAKPSNPAGASDDDDDDEDDEADEEDFDDEDFDDDDDDEQDFDEEDDEEDDNLPAKPATGKASAGRPSATSAGKGKSKSSNSALDALDQEIDELLALDGMELDDDDDDEELTAAEIAHARAVHRRLKEREALSGGSATRKPAASATFATAASTAPAVPAASTASAVRKPAGGRVVKTASGVKMRIGPTLGSK
ncbi:hypothetical protein CAOG_07654 [Capsaspora owczarzaki ATCC 30864]|uniref:Uncharacterized protein n=1 Tax=Capsaspora owczarzaki (strain ATCC 30864) TaxID=595528 RepID=A0A0D2UQD5_CAPO3|nr:hypothetical protein CAOG_07654 [Capsaspora owczarzaki ATCC 30864]KJE97211.1 hypothetical protein CAOG_007654 [Capsaspora owczarzaki ATCC 30864]|eukprot:XP_004343528.2 hypothetical protein CAOG_07654 [Capsaspora owczarzaki ATCC 30864]